MITLLPTPVSPMKRELYPLFDNKLIISLYLTVSLVGIRILKKGTLSSYLKGSLSVILSKNFSNVADPGLILTSYTSILPNVTFKGLNLFFISLLKISLDSSDKLAPIDQMIEKAR